MTWEFIDRTCHPSVARVSSVNQVVFSNVHNSLFYSTGDIVHYDLDRMHPYAYFRAHEEEIISMRACQNGVLSISSQRLALHNAGGLLQSAWSFEDVLSMATSKVLSTNVFIGSKDFVHIVSLRSKERLSTTAIDSPAMSMAASEMLYVGHESGILTTIDPRTLSIVNRTDTHPAGVSSVWVEDQLLVTAGFTYKQDLQVPDNTLRVYDTRTMKLVMPWPIPLGASSVKISPLPSRMIYALCPLSYQIASVNMDREPLLRETISLAQNDDILCFDFSSNNQYIAYGTAMGALNLISSNADTAVKIGGLTVPLRYPSDDFGETSSLPSRSSDWLGDDRYWGRTRPMMDARLQASAQNINGLGYARNERGILPNQVNILHNAGNSLASANPFGSPCPCVNYTNL